MSARSILAPLLAMLVIAAPVAASGSAQAASGLIPAADHQLSDPEAANHQGLLQLQAHDLVGAIASFSLAISQAPDSAEYLKNRARAYAAEGNAALALDDVNSALKIAPNDRNLRMEKVQLSMFTARPSARQSSPAAGHDDDTERAARIAVVTPQVRGLGVVRNPATFDPGLWSRPQYDGFGRDMSMSNAIQDRTVAAYQEQRAARLAEQARSLPEP